MSKNDKFGNSICLFFLLIISAVFIFGSCSVQRQLVKNMNTEGVLDDEKMLLGIVNRDGLQLEEYKAWFQSNYNNYTVEQDAIAPLNTNLRGIQIKVFIGTWCSDSQREIPAFYKILDALEFDQDNLTMIAIDRSKKLPSKELKDFAIEYVPTFIFYKEDKEIGRIIESPTLSLEEDMLGILK